MKLLEGKNAIITGCNRGIGAALVETFASDGAAVIWACARKRSDEYEEKLEELSQKTGCEIYPCYFDLMNHDEIKSGLKGIFSQKKTVDILVNNAGIISPNALFQMTSVDTMRRVFEVNFFSQMLITQLVSRVMSRQKSGSVVFFSSIAGLDGDPAQLEYSASKAAIIGAVKKLSRELGAQGIRVNAVAPGLTETHMVHEMQEELRKNEVEKTILKRLAAPREIAEATAFLASDRASFITGQILRVDGGR
ncbi:MAG: SDR family oxidoreductase [Planctomycetia bacterium]|nr:SDR family oxidoreductase [Planctomycetia bacterium]